MNFKPPAPVYLGPPSKHSGVGNKPIKRIVLHGTVSPTVPGGARNIARYFRSTNARGSAHYVVDPGEVVQVGYDSLICWHAPPNPGSLGVEMCDPVGDRNGKPLPMKRWWDENHTKMLHLTADLVADLCLAYDVPVRMVNARQLARGMDGICEHADVSQAFKQSTHWDLGNFPRRRFLRLVKRMVKAKLEGPGTPTPAPRNPTRVDKARDLLEQVLRGPRNGALRKKKIRAGLDVLPKH